MEILYMCSECEQLFQTEKEARLCENSHGPMLKTGDYVRDRDGIIQQVRSTKTLQTGHIVVETNWDEQQYSRLEKVDANLLIQKLEEVWSVLKDFRTDDDAVKIRIQDCHIHLKPVWR